MSSFDDRFRAFSSEVAATPGKRVLVVEGSTDIDFLTWMFDKPPLKGMNLPARWVMGDAGGKTAVVRMLEKRPEWVGLVDRDAASQDEIDAAIKKTPNLFLLPRYCIENYLTDPRLLDQMLDMPRFAKQKKPLEYAKQQIKPHYSEAIRHGSLWRAVQPLQDALQELGFNGALLKYSLPGDAEVKQTLQSWSQLMDWQRIYAQYEQFQETASALPLDKALARWVHGKMLWRNVVGPQLSEALGGVNKDKLARRLFRMMDLPEDVHQLMQRLMNYRPKK